MLVLSAADRKKKKVYIIINNNILYLFSILIIIITYNITHTKGVGNAGAQTRHTAGRCNTRHSNYSIEE
jgi:hypothetical protein